MEGCIRIRMVCGLAQCQMAQTKTNGTRYIYILYLIYLELESAFLSECECEDAEPSTGNCIDIVKP